MKEYPSNWGVSLFLGGPIMECIQNVDSRDAAVAALGSLLSSIDPDKITGLESFLDQLERSRWKFRCPNCRKAYNPDSIAQMKPSEAIITCLSELDRPVGVGFLRRKLETQGYPMRRFGRRYSYFYTSICRLVEGGKIQRLEGDEIMLSA